MVRVRERPGHRRPASRMVTGGDQGLVIAVLGLGEAGSAIAGDLAAAGVRVRGYDPAVTAAGPVLDTGSEAEAAHGAHLVLSVNSAKAAVDALKAGLPPACAGPRAPAGAGADDPWLRDHPAAERAPRAAPPLDRTARGTRQHAVRRAAEMEAAASMLTELGVPPLMAGASRALHERL